MARKLYWGSGSSWCWRLQIVLEEKALEYESHLLSFSQGDHKKPPVSTLNPRGQLPTFVDGSLVICESGAACQYLEEEYPASGLRLIPHDVKLKARVLQFMYEANNMADIFTCIFRSYQEAQKGGAPLEGPIWNMKTARLGEELGFWESSLTGKTFLMGDSFTMADAFLYPFIASCVRSSLSLEKYPALSAYYSHMSERESVKKTRPPHWKEGPGVPAMANL